MPTHFNPRSPHGERRMRHMLADNKVLFQPTLPARGATLPVRRFQHHRREISTHAPRTGSDARVMDRIPDEW